MIIRSKKKINKINYPPSKQKAKISTIKKKKKRRHNERLHPNEPNYIAHKQTNFSFEKKIWPQMNRKRTSGPPHEKKKSKQDDVISIRQNIRQQG